MTIVYLDIDDEITSAVGRIRASEGALVALVLPAGSRLGTSRMNFRLLAREAQLHARQLAIICPEASTRALAASAGLPAYGSVRDYEVALEAPGGGGAAGSVRAPVSFAVPPAPDAETPAAGFAPPADVPTPADVPAPAAPPVPGAHPSVPVARGAGRAGVRRGGLLVGLGIVGLIALILVVAGALLLPSASVLVIVRPESLGPLRLTVTADPSVAAPDATTGVIPAERVTFPLSASGTFPATGKKVTETKATGAVRWQNCDPTRSYRIPAGTVVRTPGGIGFAIDETVFLPVAILSGNPPTITCQVRDVPVTATKPGEAGNVDAGAITVVPAAYNSVVIRVVNPAPTAGGSRSETPLVSQKDVAGARKQLLAQLDQDLRAAIANPALISAGRVAVPATASRTDPVPSVDPTTLVGQEVATFDLAFSATGSLTVVDPAAVRAVGEERLRTAVPPGYELVPGSSRVELDAPEASGVAAAFPVSATARVVRQVDEAAIRREVAGRSLDEARRALAGYGEVTIRAWPAWVTTLPTFDFRLDVTVRTEADGPAGSPPGSGAP